MGPLVRSDLSARSRRPKTIRPTGGASSGLPAPPPARFSSQPKDPRGSDLTTNPRIGLLPPGAALLDRHPPHFSTAVYRVWQSDLRIHGVVFVVQVLCFASLAAIASAQFLLAATPRNDL